MALHFLSGKTWIINPMKCPMIVTEPKQFRLRSLLHLDNGTSFFIKAGTIKGVGVGEDVVKLKDNYGLECNNTVDLKQACNAFLGIETKMCMGLKGYARELLGFEFQKSKSATKSNWERQNLKESQIRYACLDAFISYLLGCKVLEEKSD